ncbi:hypothetical protein KI387_029503 [Taxus chinensis]|uniref:RING-type domain-containing protein n=1 Tax=Taxus chinensis TaxID=29808 RepID=A0AA38FE84_TAXCH|nr:hypothetical protein KI387_029503 [Taxus chinensis]
MESPSSVRYDPWELFEERLRTNLPHRVPMLMDEDDFWRYGRAMSPDLQNFVRASPLRFSNRINNDERRRKLGQAFDACRNGYSPEKGQDREDFFSKQHILRLPCNHRFHSECLTPWIKSHGQCPVCRLDLTGRCSEGGASPHRNNEENGVQVVVNATVPDEMALLIRAMEEALAWLNPSHR